MFVFDDVLFKTMQDQKRSLRKSQCIFDIDNTNIASSKAPFKMRWMQSAH
jgi:hypothetical protein